MGRKIAWLVSLALLLVTGCLGVYNGMTEWGEGRTLAQQSVTAGVLLYGVIGLVTAYGLFRRRRWSVGAAIVWGVAITYVPGVAVMAYADADTTLGSAIAASVASALIAFGVIWAARVNTGIAQRSS
jgi:hypothetical protein